jgi:DNA gyrase subunit B
VGKEANYAFTDEERDKLIKTMTEAAAAKKASNKKAKAEEDLEESAETSESADDLNTIVTHGVKVNVQRYKGLGEMNPDQLWETTLNPEHRVMLQVNIQDAEKVSEVFEILMGDEVPPRKRFITTHAKSVKNLDL